MIHGAMGVVVEWARCDRCHWLMMESSLSAAVKGGGDGEGECEGCGGGARS